jgi:hypothetical protein
MMAAAATDDDEKGRADRNDVTDQRVLARILEMRGQGYSFHDIAAALAKQGFITLSVECVRDLLDAHLARKRTTE